MRGFHWWPVNSLHKWPVIAENVSIWWRHHDHSTFIHRAPTSSILVYCPWLYCRCISLSPVAYVGMTCASGIRGRFIQAYELLNPRALKFSPVNKMHIFQCMGKIFVCNFKGYLWNYTQNILPIHWKKRFWYNIEILRALAIKSSQVFHWRTSTHHWADRLNLPE